ncbi:3-hydroxyacyl-CoA dehydrogenase family protein [Chloroflexota bacterium]
MKKVGVVGCGTMGSGIAQVCAQSNYEVVIAEVNNELLSKGLASISSFLTKSVEKGKLSQQDKDAVLGRIKGTTNIQDLSSCDLVIEAALENIDVKKKVFAELDKICPEHTILATNTSSLSVIEIASATNRGDRFLGLHFFNPVPLMKLLEVVRTVAASDDTLKIGKSFGESLGKTVVVAPDVPGFIVNRLGIAFWVSVIRMLEDGIASKEDIDTAITLGLGHPMGPFALRDLVGLDVSLDIANAMYEQTKDPRYAPPTLLRSMVSAGWLGRKIGKGFYEYKKE